MGSTEEVVVDRTKRLSRWYFGGLAASGAACCTHPLDLLKVHLQTQQTQTLSLPGMAKQVVRNDGLLGLYNGLSASLFRQMTYSTVRFAIYESVKKSVTQSRGDSSPLPFYQKVLLAAGSGACGGLCGTPGDMVNVRMQNDMKLPRDQRRNYKHAIDGLRQVIQQEGFSKIFNGASMATCRAVLLTVGQSTVATIITQPVDVMKTRMMNAKSDEIKGIGDCFVKTAKLGPSAFYKGFVPAFIRLAPQTVLMFVFFEQLRLNFGYLPSPPSSPS